MDVVNYKKFQDYKKDHAISVYLQALTEVSQDKALNTMFGGKVGLMVQYALNDDGSTVTWANIVTWQNLADNATALALLETDTDIHGMFESYIPE
jgi:hypothetical protein